MSSICLYMSLKSCFPESFTILSSFHFFHFDFISLVIMAAYTNTSASTGSPSQKSSQLSAFSKFRKQFLAHNELLVEWEDLDENLDLVVFKVRTAETIHGRAVRYLLILNDDC